MLPMLSNALQCSPFALLLLSFCSLSMMQEIQPQLQNLASTPRYVAPRLLLTPISLLVQHYNSCTSKMVNGSLSYSLNSTSASGTLALSCSSSLGFSTSLR